MQKEDYELAFLLFWCTCILAELNEMTQSSTNRGMEVFVTCSASAENMPACLFPPFRTLVPDHRTVKVKQFS